MSAILMRPSWSFQSPLLGTIYDTKLDIYIQWVDENIFLFKERLTQLFLIKQCLILTYRNSVQEAGTFVKSGWDFALQSTVWQSVSRGLAAK